MTSPAARSLIIATGGRRKFLDLSTGGIFTRASEASYLTGTPTDGSTPFIDWVPNDTRRAMDNRGDGQGNCLLMERSSANSVIYSEDLSQALGWASIGTPTLTGGQGAPDGMGDAYRVQCGTLDAMIEAGSSNAFAFTSCSAFIRSYAGTTAPNMNLFRSVSGTTALSTSTSGNFSRLFITGTQSGLQQRAVVPVDGRNWSGVGGVVAGGRDHVVWGVQREETLPFPTSYIRTSGAIAQRFQENLNYNDGDYPEELLNGIRFKFGPDALPPEIGTTQWVIFSFGASDFLSVYYNAGAGGALFEMFYNGGLEYVSSDPVYWTSRGQMLTITASPITGSLTISGASIGNGRYNGGGSAKFVSDGSLFWGRYIDNSFPVTGRFADTAGIGFPSICAV